MVQPRRRRTRAVSRAAKPQSGNRLLAALPPDEYARIRPHLTTVQLEQKQQIAVPNRRIEAVYFPIDSVTSVLAVTSDGGRVEVATIGNEGLAGLPVFLGAESSPSHAFVQVPGSAERMTAEVFRREASHDGALRQLLQRYAQGFLNQVSQATVCNQRHSAGQRLARWLLAVQDRVGCEEFQLTHEFMGQMLGVRRETVSDVAGALQQRRLISYRWGKLRVVDRPGLERAACECYRIVRNEFERLLQAPNG
jgi:CRP-like cAMP-binding protein